MSTPLNAVRRTFGLAAGMLLVTASPLLAHTGIGPAHGMVHGLAHPLGGWDHLLAMVAVGLLAAQRGGRATWLLPLSFVVGMLAGGALGVSGIAVPGVEAGVVLSVILLGAMVAASARLPLAASALLVALLAVTHGHAHGTEMPAAVSAASYAIGFTLATALLHAAGAAAVITARALAGQARGAVSVRLAGSAIGAAGALLIVLRVAA